MKDFYNITLPDGAVSDAFEAIFAKIEAVAAEALAAVITQQTWPLPSDQ